MMAENAGFIHEDLDLLPLDFFLSVHVVLGKLGWCLLITWDLSVICFFLWIVHEKKIIIKFLIYRFFYSHITISQISYLIFYYNTSIQIIISHLDLDFRVLGFGKPQCM